MAAYGKMREEVVLQPVSGKALPVHRGEVYRVVQEDPSGICVDFNCYNLHDYEEHVSTSISRRQGLHIPKGGFAISDSPRNRLMLQVLDKPDTCIIDMLGHRCSPAWCEAIWGFPDIPNCQDSLAEAIGEYGLTPDHTHASYTFWMPTGWGDDGQFLLRRNSGVKPGDHVDLLALMDVLAVSCICGANDLTPLGNYFSAPIRLQIFEASDETEQVAADVARQYPPLAGQVDPNDFRTEHKIADRELRRVPDYEPRFKRYPLKFTEIEAQISADDFAEAERLVEQGLRSDVADAIRSGVIGWYNGNRARQHPIANRFGASY